MSPWIVTVLAVLAVSDPRTAVFEHDGVRVEVAIRSQIYTWTVTNVDAPPIVGFEVGHHHMYNASGPNGWTVELGDDRITARTGQRRYAITPGRSAAFEARVSSSGGVLGLVPCAVTGADGQRRELPDVWGATHEPGSMVVIVTGSLVAIMLLHCLVTARRERRQPEASPAGG